VNQSQIRIGRDGAIEALVFRALDERRRGNLRKGCAVQLNRNGVERYVEFRGDLRLRHVGAKPGLVVVAQRGQLRAIGLHGVAVEIDLLAMRRPGGGRGREWIGIQLNQR